MDKNVIAAMARWPDVPHAYGWLSLDARGRLRLHPEGDSARGGPGQPIAHAGAQAFLLRNYAGDPRGCWYVQNGPQRAYVRLDAAPYILRRADDGRGLVTHNGLAVRRISQWWLDDAGRLYARCEHGPGQIEDRDLAGVLADLRDADGVSLLDWLAEDLGNAAHAQGPLQLAGGPAGPAPLALLNEKDAETALGFVRLPAPA